MLKRFSTLLVMGMALCAVFVVPSAFAAIINLAPGGGGDYPSIQAALNSASDGDVIELAPGTYAGTGNRDLEFYANVTVRGSGDPRLTILDCYGSASDPHSAFRLWEETGGTVENLTLRKAWNTSGGAVATGWGSYTFRNCRFVDNHASRGGAWYGEQEGDVTFEQCVFVRNTAADKGGALSATDQSSVTVVSCTFTANGAPEGGGVHLESDASASIESSILAWNRQGGAAMDYYGAGFVINCCDFFGNVGGDFPVSYSGSNNLNVDPRLADPWADEPEVGLALSSPCRQNMVCSTMGAGAELDTDGVTYDVYADGTGMVPTIQDAVYLVGGTADVIALGDGDFSGTGNQNVVNESRSFTLRSRSNDPAACRLTAEGGSSLGRRHLLITGDLAEVQLRGLSFHNGYTARTVLNGGSVLAEGDNQLTVSNCVFRNNSAVGSGGAIAKTDGTLILEDVLLEENVAFLSGGAIFTADVFIDANACRLDGNQVTEGEVGGWQISHPVDESVIVDVEVGNTQGSGIGVVELDAVLTFRSCLFWDNESSGSGGGLQILGDVPADALVEDCEFHGNISGSLGGGLRSNCQTAVFHCLFLFNQAEDGGGLFSVDGHLVNNVFTDNIATGGNPSRGGGACLSDGMVFDNRFERNTADNGGGLYVRDLIVPLTGGIFLDNTATEGGGGLYVGTGEVDTSTFVRNHANRGGGLYHEDHYVWRSVFWDNSVDGNGAAVLTPTQSYLIQCTIVGNTVISEEPRGAQVVAWRGWDEPLPYIMPALHRCIVAFGHNCGVLDVINENFPWPKKDMPEEPSRGAYCSLIHGNDIEYWSVDNPPNPGCLSSDPLFCDLEAGDLTLHSNSPALPENNDCGELMGFFGVGCTVASGVEDGPPSAVTALLGNHPNPFNPSTTVEFVLARDGQVVLEVVDLKGRRVARLVSEHRLAGQHAVRWDGRDDAGRELPSGIYLARLVAAGSVSAHRLALIR